MKYCKNCDKNYPDDKKFCSDCGKGLTEFVEKPAEEVEPKKYYEVYVPWKKIILIAIAIGAIIVVGNLTGMFALPGGVVLTTTTIPVTTTSVPETVCNKPYIKYGKECCLDSDNNGMCDKDEIKPDCPYECCEDNKYQPKKCDFDEQCIDNSCVKKDCPYECCIDAYKIKQCSYNEECVNNECVKKACPYDCCDGTIYQAKSCSSGYECVNDKCEEIKVPKLSLNINACRTWYNVLEMRHEVTDIYATVTNYGKKEAINVKITSTASDIENPYIKSGGTISVLPADSTRKFKVTVDTKFGNQSEVSVTASCYECSPNSITESSSDCYLDWEKVKGIAGEFVELAGKFI